MKNLFNNSGNFGSYIVNKDRSVSILLYGDIGENVGVSSEMIVARLMELSKTYSHIDVRINSNGGDVFSGFAIYNALKSSSMDITIHVDGLAASIAGAIALCGKPVYMSRNARLMLHGVSVGMYGNKQEFERVLALIHSLEGSLANMLSYRLKMSEEEIKSRFFDGVDHWFTAEEALQQGLIDGIDEPLEELKELEVNNKNPQEIYSIYYNHFVNMNTTPDFFNKVKEISFFSSMNEAEILDCLAVFAQQGITNVSARAALQFACKRGFITEDERDNMYSVLGGDPIKTAQYIRVKEDIYNKKFHDEYVAYMDEQTSYPIGRLIPAFTHDKELEDLAKHDFKAFKKLVERCPKGKFIKDILDLDGSNSKDDIRNDRSRWGLYEYRRYAPEELLRDPVLYNRLKEQEKEKNKTNY